MRYLTVLAALAVLAAAGNATAAPDCTDAPRSEWMSQAAMRKLVDKMDYKEVRSLQVEDSCYEVYAFTKDGRRAEAYFNPVTGKKVEEELD
jgi:hypothetical protein